MKTLSNFIDTVSLLLFGKVSNGKATGRLSETSW